MDERPVLFYDGDCGLCHWAVGFTLRHDPEGRFRFAPLGGESFKAVRPPGPLPDSFVLLQGGRTFVRSEATIRMLRVLGGGWAVLGGLARLVPRALRDATYDWIARHRHGWFRRPEAACPPVPAHWRDRFLP